MAVTDQNQAALSARFANDGLNALNTENDDVLARKTSANASVSRCLYFPIAAPELNR